MFELLWLVRFRNEFWPRFILGLPRFTFYCTWPETTSCCHINAVVNTVVKGRATAISVNLGIRLACQLQQRILTEIYSWLTEIHFLLYLPCDNCALPGTCSQCQKHVVNVGSLAISVNVWIRLACYIQQQILTEIYFCFTEIQFLLYLSWKNCIFLWSMMKLSSDPGGILDQLG
jgi:hypothetical protein